MSSTLRRRVRARMIKTGESYQTALRNYLKTHPQKASQPAEVAPAEATPSLDLRLGAGVLGRSPPNPSTSDT